MLFYLLAMNAIVTLINELNNHSMAMADSFKKEEKLDVQSAADHDKSWSVINMHHAPTFYRSVSYFSGFPIFLIIGAVLCYLFCCGGLQKFIALFSRPASTAINASQAVLPTHNFQN